MQAVVAALVAGCPAAVERNRRSRVDATEAPHLNVFGGGHVAAYDDPYDVAYTVRVGIEATVGAASDAALEPAATALYARAIAAVMADPSLAGLCIQVREVNLDVRLVPAEESAAPLIEFGLELEIDFRTPDGDPTG